MSGKQLTTHAQATLFDISVICDISVSLDFRCRRNEEDSGYAQRINSDLALVEMLAMFLFNKINSVAKANRFKASAVSIPHTFK